ncbi:MAG TPA: AI-2E family transporter [candidate division Zixibacteria bacterium]|nr:AI-2E family transporter [candidate division Zixibacteria bacterium]
MDVSKRYLTLQSVALPLIALAGGTAFFYFAAPIVIPIVISISLAYILSPLVAQLDKFKFPHTVSVTLVLLVSLVIIGLLGYVIFLQTNNFLQDLPNYWNSILKFLNELKIKLSALGLQNSDLLSSLEKIDISAMDLQDFSGVGKYLAKGLSSVISLFFGGFLIFFLTFFILSDQKNLQNRVIKALGAKEEKVSQNILSEINSQIKSFILVKFLITVALTVVFTVGLLIMGVNYAYIWGPLAAILNLIPFIGAVIGVIPPALVALIQFDSFFIVLVVVIFFVVVQALESNLISPKLLADKVNLNPLAILIVSMYWGWLWGAIGVILAVPITACFKVICDHLEALQPIGILLGGKSK